ncbi:hypothetical protein LB519_08825 [Mesorhizobium sp. AD1-1]|nr:hypothetical protein [Mesorhizobium sp. AD1-1]
MARLSPTHFPTMFCDNVAVEQDLGRIEGPNGKGHMPQFVAAERTAASIERIAGRALLIGASPQLHDNFKEPFG